MQFDKLPEGLQWYLVISTIALLFLIFVAGVYCGVSSVANDAEEKLYNRERTTLRRVDDLCCRLDKTLDVLGRFDKSLSRLDESLSRLDSLIERLGEQVEDIAERQ